MRFKLSKNFGKIKIIIIIKNPFVVFGIVLVVVIVHGSRNHRKTAPKSCTLPKHPANGRWSILGRLSQSEPGRNIPCNTILSVGCDGQYTLNGQSVIKCENGKWSSTIGECLKLCPPVVTTPSTLVTCISRDKTVSDCTKAANGTVATFKCASYYENPELNRNPFRVCINGSWGKEVPSCTPICGIKPDPPTKDKRSYYPWNIAIFGILDGKKYMRCAGTLINERIILTYATCVADEKPKPKPVPVNSRLLAAGKSTDEYNDARDTEAQYSDVEDIFIVEDFKGSTRKYINNIAIVVAKTPFNMTSRVQPACFDWNNKYSKIFQYPGVKGYVPGPLKDSFFNLSEVFEIDVPFVNDTTCYQILSSEPLRADFQAFYSYEKICAGYINSDQSPKCLLDAGVGLISKNPYDDKYYVTGITALKASVFYRDRKNCDNQRWVLFLALSKFHDFIVEKNDLYTPIRRSYFQTSCGTKSVQAQTLIVNGKNVTKGDYPWQVALYQIENTRKRLVCGGSLINQRVIITAAHCVTSLDGQVMPKGTFVVSVGKYFRNFSDTRDTAAQFSALKEIFVPTEYQGDNQNYVGDIAILVTENSFVLSKDVEPVCLDWDGKYENQFLRPSVTGFVPGWGLTKENSNPSEVLKELEVPYVEKDECKNKLPSDYEIYLTPDKMCSGHLNKGSSVCSGDSGGGLVFKNKNDDKYYLAGVVSLSPQAPTGGCDSQQLALYTRVSTYISSFILEKVRLYWA